MTSISPTSMIRASAIAIGLSNYSQPVMSTRTIVLPPVRKTLAQAPAPSRGDVRSRGKRQRVARGASFARPYSVAVTIQEP